LKRRGTGGSEEVGISISFFLTPPFTPFLCVSRIFLAFVENAQG
jgi:hypothetical protein